jgi:hypothetical protein
LKVFRICIASGRFKQINVLSATSGEFASLFWDVSTEVFANWLRLCFKQPRSSLPLIREVSAAVAVWTMVDLRGDASLDQSFDLALQG